VRYRRFKDKNVLPNERALGEEARVQDIRIRRGVAVPRRGRPGGTFGGDLILEPLIIDEPCDGVRRLTLNRPEKHNALNPLLVEALVAACEAADKDGRVRVLIVRGNGPSFCAGADIHEYFLAGGGANDIGLSALWDGVEGLSKPVIAAVHGWAITGGFLLAYCCDLIVASDDAVFRDTHAALGLIPSGGETQRLPRRISPFLARELLLTSRPLPAAEAQAAGLVNRVVARDELDAAALALAADIVTNSGRAVSAIKQLVNVGLTGDFASGLWLERLVNRSGEENQVPNEDRDSRLSRFRSASAADAGPNRNEGPEAG
jgi:enoyl-CoA hydratase